MIQIIESLILFTLFITVVLNSLPYKTFHKYASWVAYVSLGLGLLDIVLGNFRWQMVLAYTFSILMVIFIRFRKPNDENTRWFQKLFFSGYVLVTVLISIIAIILPKAFVMFELPAPSGKYQVGIQDIHLIDNSRPELETEDQKDHRELMLRVWYPATVEADSTPQPFIREIEPPHQIFSRWVPLPAFALSHLKKIESHSYLNAPMIQSNGEYPLLVFNHGNSFYASQNSILMEELASHGYVVIAIDYPHHASWVKFPDGKVISYKSGMPMDFSEEELSKFRKKAENDARALLRGPYEDYYNGMKEGIEGSVDMNDRVEVWIKDIAFVLDELEAKNEPFKSFTSAVDFDKIGVFGMSLGGAAAGKFCLEDARCKAILNMDGTQFGHGAMKYEFKKPFLMMNSDVRYQNAGMIGEVLEPNALQKYEMNDFLLQQSKSISYNMVVDKTTHGSYSDFLMMTADLGSWTGLLGTIDPWTMKDILNEYTLAFFNQYLQGTEEELLLLDSQKRPEIIKYEVVDNRVISENVKKSDK